MKTRLFSSNAFYICSIVFILCWWTAALSWKKSPSLPINPKQDKVYFSPLPIKNSLSPIDRDELIVALQGNIPQMTQMMATWDLEAELMEDQGFKNIHRLPRKAFLEGQLIGRLLTQQKDLQTSSHLFLPQTLVSASLLLALVPHSEIAALPKAIRQYTVLFPKEITKQIPLDIESCSLEQLFKLRPTVALVASYSNPSIRGALEDQGVMLKQLKQTNSIEDLKEAVIQIGQIINRPLKAKLFSLFIESAIQAMDNRLSLIRASSPRQDPRKILCLNRFTNYSVPTKKTLIGNLMQRLGMNKEVIFTDTAAWSLPLNSEQLMLLNPDWLLFSTDHPLQELSHLSSTPPFSNLDAFCSGSICFVEDWVQQFDSQYIVLAYFDLYQACLAAEER